MRMGIIYKATSPSGKVYIGQTSNRLIQRKCQHFSDANNKNRRSYDSAFPRALRKYGKSKIVWEILYENIPWEQLNDLEVVTIAEYDSFYNGYNSTLGGKGNVGYKHTDETKAKIGKSSMERGKGYKHTAYAKARIGEASKGRKHTDEAKAKMSEAGKERKASNETRAKISKANSGENCYNAKLTWKKVAEIRELYKQVDNTYQKIANKYGVSKGNIRDIIKNKIWKV